MAEEKIARMKKGIYSYLKVCWEDYREARLKEKRSRKKQKNDKNDTQSLKENGKKIENRKRREFDRIFQE